MEDAVSSLGEFHLVLQNNFEELAENLSLLFKSVIPQEDGVEFIGTVTVNGKEIT